jgi:hypothetical protein
VGCMHVGDGGGGGGGARTYFDLKTKFSELTHSLCDEKRRFDVVRHVLCKEAPPSIAAGRGVG